MFNFIFEVWKITVSGFYTSFWFGALRFDFISWVIAVKGF
jgi:hypothetical protein